MNDKLKLVKEIVDKYKEEICLYCGKKANLKNIMCWNCNNAIEPTDYLNKIIDIFENNYNSDKKEIKHIFTIIHKSDLRMYAFTIDMVEKVNDVFISVIQPHYIRNYSVKDFNITNFDNVELSDKEKRLIEILKVWKKQNEIK
ncbi:MAG: hypothetical protein ACFFG0_51075 [Candidatus Thorarchaeota archaeon]